MKVAIKDNEILESAMRTDEHNETLVGETIPCVYTDEELADEIRLAEASGFATDEEVEAVFAKCKS